MPVSASFLPLTKARDLLRGEPNSKVSISFIRDGVNQNEQVSGRRAGGVQPIPRRRVPRLFRAVPSNQQ